MIDYFLKFADKQAADTTLIAAGLDPSEHAMSCGSDGGLIVWCGYRGQIDGATGVHLNARVESLPYVLQSAVIPAPATPSQVWL